MYLIINSNISSNSFVVHRGILIFNVLVVFFVAMYFTKDQANKAENKSTQSDDGIMSIQNYLVPLPPLSEQHRIVAKVDELFGICDALRRRLRQR
jgi:restriction endonuclease S subunit